MKKGVKIALIVGGAAVVGVSTYLIIRKVRQKKREEAEKKRLEEENKASIESTIAALEMQQGSNTPPSSKGGCSGKVITPKRNLNRDINNNFSEIKGMTIYPAKKSNDPVKGHDYASGLATIRTSPAVNTSGNHWSGLDASNEIGIIMGDKPVGTILKEAYDNHDPKHRWFRVKLARKMEDCSGYVPSWLGGCDDVSYGWVRADTVTFKPQNETPKDCQIEKLCKGGTPTTDKSISMWTEIGFKALTPDKRRSACQAVGVTNYSSANGNFVERYDNSYPLGAEVFPHSNWMLPSGHAFECEDGLTDI